ncbi:hypothetical protein BH10PLA2_BH10PLA2_27290 [soil metagenome]
MPLNRLNLVLFVGFISLVLSGRLQAQSPPALADSLRGYLIPHIPTPLYEKRENWNQTIEAKRVHWEGKGLNLKPKTVTTYKKHGKWKHVIVSSPNVAQSLKLVIQNVAQPEPGRTTFDVVLALPAHVEYEQQNWERGLRLWSGSVRTRMRVALHLNCELTTRLEPGAKLLPEMVLRVRVLHATTGYDQLVVEHLPGIGGDAAKILGEAVVENMKKWHPSIERNLLERLNAAIVKAGDSKEIRVGLTGLQRPAKK